MWLGYAAFILSFPYPLLKIYWSLGGTLWGGQNFGHHSAFGKILVFGASALLSLALVQRWGRIFPRWVPFFAGKKVPRWIFIIGGWIAACMTAFYIKHNSIERMVFHEFYSTFYQRRNAFTSLTASTSFFSYPT
ncbi:hypothetical protein [Paenibacillus beijingensis]|uniref:hypothetical protein n=1 Tax=Paenibacillus beijingensis TaxID=1126833 RepID=UPI0009E3E3CC|nr:hypothetical protein [Paenibacillus beijingensis]